MKTLMNIFGGISFQSKFGIINATIVMFSFFVVKTLLLFRILDYSEITNWYEYLSVIFFMPPFFVVMGDIFRRTKTIEEDAYQKLNAIDATNLIATFNDSGKVISVNKNFCDLMGYTEEELIGQEHKLLVPKEFANSYDYVNFWLNLRNGNSNSGEFERITKNGESKFIMGNYVPIRSSNGKYSVILKVATDITQQHESDVLINQKNTYLEHAAKILRHDMHSGINTYIPRGLSSLKRRLAPEIIKELKIESPIKMIEEGLKHTQKVYVGVREFTNLVKEDVQLDKTLCDLSKILNEYLKTTSYGKQVAIDVLPEIEVNEALFCTAIDNLIRNGLKYNDSDTKMVAIYMENEDTLCVHDNGRGMSQEDFLQLSKPYTRKTNQKEMGSGLGLNICVSILKEHGFTLTSENTGEGTLLRIKIKS